jgi:hypothetical protein
MFLQTELFPQLYMLQDQKIDKQVLAILVAYVP